MFRKVCLLIPLLITPLRAQQTADQQKLLQEVLRRLDVLEQQNRELLEQVKELRQVQGSSMTATNQQAGEPRQARLDERVKVNEARIAEQAQTKVESSQRLPVTLYGTLLFNAFANNKDVSTSLGDYGLLSGPGQSGATLRQTTLGLSFQGPTLPGGGHVDGDIAMDFWAGPPNPSSNWLRIRRAGISFDWTNTSIFVGQDKPLISPYEPDSLAEVGVPPMAGAGNLWFWLPQVRFEQKFNLGQANGVDAQVAVLQVGSYLETSTSSTSQIYSGGVRPALEGRVGFWHKSGDGKKFEIGPGFQISSNQVDGADIISRIGSVDWLYQPLSKLLFKGTGYYGQNVASLGSLGNGFYETSEGDVHAVLSKGGWAQISVPLNNRVTLNSFAGLENDHSADLTVPGIARSASFTGNVMFHLSSNVLLSVEAQRLWTRTFAGQSDSYNHYDLALAYLF